MNRREFTKSLAALGLAPALPGVPKAAAAAPATAAFTPYMYGLGAHLARSTGGCSADILMRKLRLAPEVARAMQAQLVRQGIVTAPNATGLAMAARPYMQGAKVVAAAPSGVSDTIQSIAQHRSEDCNDGDQASQHRLSSSDADRSEDGVDTPDMI